MWETILHHILTYWNFNFCLLLYLVSLTKNLANWYILKVCCLNSTQITCLFKSYCHASWPSLRDIYLLILVMHKWKPLSSLLPNTIYYDNHATIKFPVIAIFFVKIHNLFVNNLSWIMCDDQLIIILSCLDTLWM